MLGACAARSSPHAPPTLLTAPPPGRPAARPRNPPDACAQKSGVMGGDYLVVSLNSMTAPRLPALTAFNPAACCAACGATDGCNAWSFCAEPKGCGKAGACKAYSDANPKLQLKALEAAGLDRFKFPQKVAFRGLRCTEACASYICHGWPGASRPLRPGWAGPAGFGGCTRALLTPPLPRPPPETPPKRPSAPGPTATAAPWTASGPTPLAP
jgi:hypothetical protein